MRNDELTPASPRVAIGFARGTLASPRAHSSKLEHRIAHGPLRRRCWLRCALGGRDHAIDNLARNRLSALPPLAFGHERVRGKTSVDCGLSHCGRGRAVATSPIRPVLGFAGIVSGHGGRRARRCALGQSRLEFALDLPVLLQCGTGRRMIMVAGQIAYAVELCSRPPHVRLSPLGLLDGRGRLNIHKKTREPIKYEDEDATQNGTSQGRTRLANRDGPGRYLARLAGTGCHINL